MKSIRNTLKIITVTCTIGASLTACSQQTPHHGIFPFSMMEKPPQHGTARKQARNQPGAKHQELTRMKHIMQYSPAERSTFTKKTKLLQAGDVIAFHMSQKEASGYLSRGVIQKAPYSLFRFGHLAVLVPAKNELRLLQVAMRQSVNTDRTMEYLRDKSWVAYRPPSGSISVSKLAEFSNSACKKGASPEHAYDFRATFGFSNGNLYPKSLTEVRSKYTCATLVVAALSYSGYDLHTLHRSGKLDILTPRQVTDSWGAHSRTTTK